MFLFARGRKLSRVKGHEAIAARTRCTRFNFFFFSVDSGAFLSLIRQKKKKSEPHLPDSCFNSVPPPLNETTPLNVALILHFQRWMGKKMFLRDSVSFLSVLTTGTKSFRRPNREEPNGEEPQQIGDKGLSVSSTSFRRPRRIPLISAPTSKTPTFQLRSNYLVFFFLLRSFVSLPLYATSSWCQKRHHHLLLLRLFGFGVYSLPSATVTHLTKLYKRIRAFGAPLFPPSAGSSRLKHFFKK